jgi:hypothetical protein
MDEHVTDCPAQQRMAIKCPREFADADRVAAARTIPTMTGFPRRFDKSFVISRAVTSITEPEATEQ